MSNVTYPEAFGGSRPKHRTRSNRTRAIDVLIIGGGHAGLSVSACLSEMGIDHVILERGEVAQRWRHERWDSLKLLTPNWMCQLPGMDYEDEDPDGFMGKDEVASFIQNYALCVSAPVETHTEVTMVTTWGDGYRVVTNQGEWWCRVIVNASGAYGKGVMPGISAAMPLDIHQVHAADYRNVDQLPDGGVLVVGASATGLQLANEIHASGRPVTLAVGEHVRMPRNYRGADIYWWLANSGVLDETYEEVEDIARARRLPSPQLVGSPDANLDINALTEEGIRVAGRLVGMARHKLQFSGSLANHCKSADLKMNRLLKRFDEWADEIGIAANEEHLEPTRLSEPLLELDVRDREISTIVWATGFKPDYSWLKLPVYDHKGGIKHDGGAVCLPGVYTLGQQLLRTRKSSYMYGATEDARFTANHIQLYLDTVVAGERSLMA